MPGGTLRREGARDPWSVGCAPYEIATEHDGARLSVGVYCRINGLGYDTLALLDTGAEWSILGGELADVLESKLGRSDRVVVLSTRHGPMRGRLHELDIALLAEEGSSIAIAATVLLAPGWAGPLVLGYRGLFERVRFALDPGAQAGDAWFFFASAG